MDELAAETMVEKKRFDLVDNFFSYKSKPALFVGWMQPKIQLRKY